MNLFHVSQAAADRWRADGRFVLFGEGETAEPERLPDDYDVLGLIVPPAAMIEAAEPCPNCDGNGGFKVDSMILYGIPGGEDWGEMCSDCRGDGQRRHPVTVPCPFPATEADPHGGVTRHGVPRRCDTNGRISTGLLAVVEFGPLEVVDGDNVPKGLTEFVGVADDGDGVQVHYFKLAQGSVVVERLDRYLPPGVDRASLVGRWAIGGRIEVAG